MTFLNCYLMATWCTYACRHVHSAVDVSAVIVLYHAHALFGCCLHLAALVCFILIDAYRLFKSCCEEKSSEACSGLMQAMYSGDINLKPADPRYDWGLLVVHLKWTRESGSSCAATLSHKRWFCSMYCRSASLTIRICKLCLMS